MTGSVSGTQGNVWLGAAHSEHKRRALQVLRVHEQLRAGYAFIHLCASLFGELSWHSKGSLLDRGLTFKAAPTFRRTFPSEPLAEHSALDAAIGQQAQEVSQAGRPYHLMRR